MTKTSSRIRRVGILANAERAGSGEIVVKVLRSLGRFGCEVWVEAMTAEIAGGATVHVAPVGELRRRVDLLLVVGGDGTMLRAAREFAGSRAPMVGINAGQLGFLTAVSRETIGASLRSLFEGRFSLEERDLLEGTLVQGGRTVRQLALNDFVLSRGVTSRLIEIEVQVNGEFLTQYRCDGLIASSPTGSTAYSLAAGGAIVSPDADVMILTPICPHTLSIRPVVVGLDSTVQVRLLSTRLVASLAADGQAQYELAAGGTVTIRRCPQRVRLARPHGTSFFSTLRQKFGWSGSHFEK